MSIRSISLASALLMFPLSIYADGIEITEIPATEVGPMTKTVSVTRTFRPFDAEFPRFSTTVRRVSSSLGQPTVQTTHLKSSGLDTFYDVLPFDWHEVADKPLLLVLPEFVEYSSTQEIEFLDLLRIFNIEVIVPRTLEIDIPIEATLIFEIRSPRNAIQVELPMYLDSIESSYFILTPNQLERELSLVLDRFDVSDDLPDRGKPWINFRELKGFSLVDENDEDRDPHMEPVAYKLRFGSFAVDSGFQNVGSKNSVDFRLPFKTPLLQDKTDSYDHWIL